MGSGCYQVDILYFLNPHLMWVEVKNSKNQDETYEQIGLYGLMPLVPSVEGSVEWTRAAVTIMEKVLKTAAEVWFWPFQNENRSSIFDDNIHKFGEIFIKKSDGKYKKLSRYLTNSKVAEENEQMFKEALTSDTIRTKLDYAETKLVTKQVEKYYKKCGKDSIKFTKCIKSETSSVQNYENELYPLTVENLKRYNRENLYDPKEKINIYSVSTPENSNKEHQNKSEEKANDDVIIPISQRKADQNEVLVAIGPAGVNINKLVVKSVSRQNGYQNTGKAGKQDSYKVKNKTDMFEDIDFDTEVNTTNRMFLKQTNCDENNVGTSSEFKKGKKFDSNYVGSHTKTDGFLNSNERDMNSKQNGTLYGNVNGLDSVKHNESPLEKLLKLRISKINNRVVEECSNGSMSDKDQSRSSKVVLNTSSYDLLNVRQRNIERVVDVDAIKSNSNALNNKLRNENVIKNHDIVNVSECENIHVIIDEVVRKYSDVPKEVVKETNGSVLIQNSQSNNVNPFKNIDPTYSVFVDKLITPVLMVHTKSNNRIEARLEVSDVCFNSHIHNVLKNMGIRNPMMLQTISWWTILRGHSFFMISPSRSGKTMGYVPAVCRLVADGITERNSVGPISIILCATSESVTYVENLCKMFLGSKKKVLACYSGFDELQTITVLLNGCDLFVCTPPSLIRLLHMTEFGLDLRRLSTVVFDDCERLALVYGKELRVFISNIDNMLKKRVFKEWKVQYIVSSRVWCDFMTSFAKKAPYAVICIRAFQECVLYSKAKTQFTFVTNENKINLVLDFLKNIDTSKRTVIVCCNDNEVTVLKKVLSENKYFVYACNSSMTIEDLFMLNTAWNDYSEPLIGPILVCCDGNLTHMNVTNAHYLLHYSLPHLFSLFCKRFSVLNDNYASIFKTDSNKVEIKILMDENNIEQLPKILNFIKRCSNRVPEVLNDISAKILVDKDRAKAKVLVPVCGDLLTLGYCPDIWNCRERHTVFKEYDEPKESVPKEGVITFEVLHYHSAVLYSAKLLTHTVLGVTKKYPPTLTSLSTKMDLYFSHEENRRLCGIPKIGDICAVAIKQNSFYRCQVVRIINNYPNGNPNNILVKLIDEERLIVTKDIYLYYLPQKIIDIDTHVIQVRLANVIPKDHDITFSKLANDQLKVTEREEELYLRGKVIMAVGNCVFVDFLEACQDLSNLKETLIMYNVKKVLAPYVIFNSDHIRNVIKLCKDLEAYKKIEEKFKTKTCLQEVQDREINNVNDENDNGHSKD